MGGIICYAVLKVKMDQVSNESIRELEELVNRKNAVLCKIQKIIPLPDVTAPAGAQPTGSLDDILNRDPMETLKEAYTIRHKCEMNDEQEALLSDLLKSVRYETKD